jgi:hypothetical protein
MIERELADDFLKALPEEVINLLKILLDREFTPVFVGGCVRDFYLLSEVAHDLDVEVHYEKDIEAEEHLKLWRKLKTTIASEYSISELPYEVFRIKVGNFELELSPPRTESFDESSDKDHHQFDCHLHPYLPLKESFKRRDFTFNAIGLRVNKINSGLIVDPFSGLKAIDNKVVEPCSEDFIHDPVRFLRAIRFYFRFGFKLSKKCEIYLSQMSLEKVTSYYLWHEAIKSARFFMFLRKVSEVYERGLGNKNSTIVSSLNVVNKEADKLDDWFGYIYKFYKKDEKGKLVLVTLGLDTKIPMDKKQEFCRYINAPSKLMEDMVAVKNILIKHSPGSFKKLLSNVSKLDYKKLAQDTVFQDIFQLKKVFKKMAWPLDFREEKSELLERIEEMVKDEFAFSADELFEVLKRVQTELKLTEEDFDKAGVDVSERSLYLFYRTLLS